VRIAVAVAALGVGAALLAAALFRARDPQLPAVASVEAHASLPSGHVRFGDTVPVRVDVLVPRRSVNPQSVRLDATFSPYRVIGRVVPRRTDDGPTTLLRYDLALECLRPECLPERDGSPFLLPPALVRFQSPGGAPGRLLVSWPVLAVDTQLGALDAAQLKWRDGISSPPAFDYRVPPRLLAVLLAALALAAALGSVRLLLPRVAAALPDGSAEDRRSVLERVLAAFRYAARGEDTGERRRSLDLLARELGTGRRHEAPIAQRLAWSSAVPGRTEMERLVDDVEREAQ
jgi:hypothetical protein